MPHVHFIDIRFAIIRLSDLRVMHFGTEDEHREAVRTLTERGVPFLPMKWSASAEVWTVQRIG